MQRVVPLKVCVLNPSYLKGPEAYVYIYVYIQRCIGLCPLSLYKTFEVTERLQLGRFTYIYTYIKNYWLLI